MQAERILIVLLGAIGDVVRAFPLVSHIKHQLPNVHITWAVETPSLGIVKCHPAVDKVVEYKRKDGLTSYLQFLKELRTARFDIALDLQRHFKSGVTSYFSKAKKRIGFNWSESRELNWMFQTDTIPSVDRYLDKTLQYLQFAEILGLGIPEKLDFSLGSTLEEKNMLEGKIADYLKSETSLYSTLGGNLPKDKRALLMIGSTWRSKEWPPEYFAKLADQIFQKFGIISLLIGHGRDQEIASKILDVSTSPILNLVNKTSLSDFKVLCSQARFGVACDSGPLHIASGVGLPCISLWGPTSPTRSRPYGNYENVLQSPIGCASCYLRVCPGLDGLCLKGITPQVVLYKIEAMLK